MFTSDTAAQEAHKSLVSCLLVWTSADWLSRCNQPRQTLPSERAVYAYQAHTHTNSNIHNTHSHLAYNRKEIIGQTCDGTLTDDRLKTNQLLSLAYTCRLRVLDITRTRQPCVFTTNSLFCSSAHTLTPTGHAKHSRYHLPTHNSRPVAPPVSQRFE